MVEDNFKGRDVSDLKISAPLTLTFSDRLATWAPTRINCTDLQYQGATCKIYKQTHKSLLIDHGQKIHRQLRCKVSLLLRSKSHIPVLVIEIDWLSSRCLAQGPPSVPCWLPLSGSGSIAGFLVSILVCRNSEEIILAQPLHCPLASPLQNLHIIHIWIVIIRLIRTHPLKTKCWDEVEAVNPRLCKGTPLTSSEIASAT